MWPPTQGVKCLQSYSPIYTCLPAGKGGRRSRRSGEASEKQRDQMVCTPGDGRDPPARICVSHPSFFPWQAKASCLLTHRVIPPPLRLCTWLHAETVVLLCSMPNLNSHSAGRMVSGRNRNGDAGERETEILEPCAINNKRVLCRCRAGAYAERICADRIRPEQQLV